MRFLASQTRRTSASTVRGAFTLVEILTVIVILGIVSAVILPQIGSRDDLRAAASARILISDLIYAQNLAISSQRTTYVRFGTNGYGLYDSPTGSTPITHPVNKTPYTATFGTGGSAGLANSAIDSRSFDGQDTLAFDELGAPYSYNAISTALTPLVAAGEVVVRSGVHRLRVSVEPFTGEVTVSPVP